MKSPSNNRFCSILERCSWLFCVFTALVLNSQMSLAQSIVVDQATSNSQVQSYVEDVLLGSCVTVSNISFTGDFRSSGTFDGSGTILGISDGIILTTGRATIAEGPDDANNATGSNNDPGDADLTSIAGANTRDAAILEFDFIPSNDTLRFNYIFGSEEYPEYVNGGFNDAFGFFVSGPGITGPYSSPGGFPNGAINVALIPGSTTAVTIDNVNNGFSGTEPATGPCMNCAYYVDNSSGPAVQYDGYTTVLTAEFVVVPCQTYHIKLAVADAGDTQYDSGVFLQGGSFSAGEGVTVELETTTIPPGIYEGCNDAWFIFRRVDGSDNSQSITADFTITGTATPGVDYSTLPSTVTIPAGLDTFAINISVFLDFITEGSETITVTLQDPPCACEAPGSATVDILDNDIALAVSTTGTTTICLGQSADLTADPTGSQTPYTAGWDNGAPTGDDVTVSPTNTTTYTYTVTDNCGGQSISSTETITVIRPDFTVDDDQQCLDGNNFSFTNTGATGGSVTHLWDFGDGNSSTQENPSHIFVADGDFTVTHYIIFTASNCTASASALVTVFPEPVITATVDQNVICTGGTDGVISTSVVGGTAAYTYLWSPGGQTSSSISGQGVGTYTVTVTDANGCTDSDGQTIIQDDPVDPTAVCQNITVQLDATGNVTISATQVNNGSSDNCGIASLVVSPNAFTCSEIGGNAVVLTVTDVNGNVSTCNATVTVEDNVDPTALCQNITVQLDATGNATIVAGDVDAGSNDNCSATISATPLTFTCANVGANTVVLTATDGSSNTDNCNATVTIQDNVDPTAICQDVTLFLDASGNLLVLPGDIDNGSNDACGLSGMFANPAAFNCSDAGDNAVTLTVTDVNGNASTCVSTVTVIDDQDPTAICQNITVQLDGAGNATITAASVDNGSNDNCTVNISATPLSFNCSNLGANTVTLTATDANGNFDNCTATVTVEDNVDPTAICQNITVQLDAAGNATITANDIDNGSNDNCSVTVSATPLTFNCANVGANTITLTATDGSGNTDDCTATVTIQDNVNPTAICQNITVQLDATGNVTISATQVDNGSSDNCAVASLVVSPNAFTCSEVGANSVTLTVTDVNGNTSTCSATVTVEDNINPTAVCQDITVQLDANGELTLTSASIDGGSTDNCGVASVTIDGGNTSQDFDCSSVGVNTILLTVTDVNGNVSTCTADVTVEDTVDPTALCQNITVQLDASGNVSVSNIEIDNASTDNCGIASITLDGGATNLNFDCSNVGANTVILTVTDVNGNVSTCTADVTVEDTVDPTALCQNITVQLDASGNVSVSNIEIDNASTDNCGIASITLDGGATSLNFDCSNVGVNTVMLTVTDVNGNVSTCTADVTVEDTVDPTALCQNITVQLDASGNASVSNIEIDNGSTDNCGIASITLDGGASTLNFDCSDVGTTTVTLTVTDVNGNVSTCTADVTIEDNIDATAVCQDITVQLDANGDLTILAADIDNGSSDNCGATTITIDGGNTSQDFDCSDVGVVTVTLTVTDANGNVSTCDADVTIEDTVDPTALCQDITVQLDANGDLTILSTDIDGGSTDNCGIASVTIDGGNTSQDFDCSDVGVNTITLTVTDVNGNVSTCDADVTIEDTVDPIAVCQDITVQLDANGDLTILSADIDGGSTDNCGIASITIDGGNTSQDFDCSDVGVNTITLTVTDVNGNVSTCDADVTIEDTVDPTALCQNITIQLDATGNASISTVDIDNGSVDNCGIATITLDGGASALNFDCSDVGTQTVTLTVTDVNGNVSTCTADITIEDTVDPTALCQDITVQLDANGDLTILSADIDGGSTDNCGVASVTIDGGNTSQDFDCSDVGVNSITLTVTDVNGNVSTCDADVTIEDTVDPTAVCQDITVQLDANGELTLLSADIDGGSTDNCGIASVTIDGGNTSQDFDCNNVGVNTITLTVTDVNGNVSTCDADVTIEDSIDPTALCQNITVQLDATGNATITGVDIDNGSADNCGIASLVAGPNAFDCSNIGVNTVTLTVTDDNGNVSTCTADVTIEDNVNPTAVCQDITVQLDANGDATIVAADVDGGSSDNCAIDNIAINITTFDCSDIGNNLVVLTVTDVNGNSSTCTASVTIEDMVPPIPVCIDIIAELSPAGTVTVAPGDVDNGSTDNCAIASITLDPNSFTCAEVGFNTVTLTVTDASGNVSTCTAQVDVQDNVLPSAACQNITVQLDASGNAVITPNMVDNGSTDACGAVTPTIVTPSSFDCSNVGVNIVTLTVEDQNGNISTCAATVTIQDIVPPVAVCQDITVQLDAIGNASITPADVDGGSSDNCAIDFMTVSPNTFTCAEEGANTVTLTVTDVNGNVSTCSSTVIVESADLLNVICQDISVFLDANGEVFISPEQLDGGSNTICGLVTLVSPDFFDCNSIGVNTVTLTGTDNNGNVSTCTAAVTVADTVSPAAVCQDLTIQLDAAGNASVAAASADNGSSDNCAIASLTLSQTAFGCAEVGGNTVTLTVTDVNGNSSTCTSTITVEDNIDPTIVCQNITVELDATGNVVITGADIDNGTTDNCSTVGSTLTLDVTPGAFDCNDVGIVTVTLTATDENGNSSSCTADVDVQDNEAPIALCQNIDVYLDAAGNVGIVPADVNNGSSDNCGIANIIVTPNSFTCSGVGPNPVTLTVTDVNGNVASCVSTVTVLDTVSPNAICQDIVVQVDASGNASIVPSQVNNGSSDACGITSLVLDVTAFDCSVVGANTVTLTVTDDNGNTSTCTSTVTVEDNVDPNALCQGITVQLDANGDASITAVQIDNGSTDNCLVASLAVTPNTFDCSNVGANTVTLTVTDVNGNTDNCTATVTVEDSINPTAVCQDITVQLDAAGNLTITSADIDGGSADNCGIASLEIDNGNTSQDFDCTQVGTNTVTLTVTDLNGNVSTCDATVTVQDTVSPTAVCQEISVQLDASGNLTITSADVDGGSSDNCGIASLEIDNGNTTQDFDCTSIGTNTVTLTVTDVNGNVSTCDATVTVQDTVTPVIVCQNITVELDANGEATITGVDLDGGTTDNCGLPVDITFTLDITDFDCSNVGVNTVVLTATDANGNVSTCSADVTIEDNIDPTALCQDITVYLDGAGNVSIVAADVDGGSSDNCGIDNLVVSQDAFVCAEVGANTVTLTVTDVNTNTATCTATVTVQDTVSPIALCQDITVQLDASGNATISALDVDNGSSDNCAIASMVANPNVFTCAEEGANTVTLTVTDVNGNASSCTSTVTVENNVVPNVVCQDITVYLDATGNVSIIADDVNGGSNASCGLASLTVSPDAFDCSNVGPNTVTLTAVDNSGNTSTCDATVTVLDTISPAAVCQDITVQLDANGDLTITSADIDGGSFDNCGIASLEINNGNTTQGFDCSNVGANTVTLTVTDVNGNVSTCDAIVTVEDTISPIAVCQDITVQLDANGELNIMSADIDGGSLDNCGIASLEIDNGNTSQDFDCSQVGTNTVTLTVTDVNGNVSTCDAIVTVEDTISPTAVCQDITVQLDANGELTIVSADIDGGSLDNCGIASLEIDNGNTSQDFDCTQVGTNTVILTVTDVNGNVSTCDAIVTVEDTISPTAVCQDITVQLDANGELTITSADIDGGSLDNCGIASLEINNGNTSQDFDCTLVGTNTVTLTVTDVNGNSSTCDATVTVQDTIDPSAVCQDITVQLDANGQLTITSADIDDGSNDNCGIASLEIDNGNTTQDFDCTQVGTNTVTLTVTDVNGNISTCDASVTVEDTISPTIVCQDITIELDLSGTVVLTAVELDGGSTDNCGSVNFDIDAQFTEFDCSQVGTHTITLTATDANGNTSTCDAQVEVENNQVPTVSCQDITVYLDAAGNVSIIADDVNGGTNASCGLASLTVSPNAFDCSNIGANGVVLTATDSTANVTTCNATVTVLDTISPTALCQDITVDLDATGNIVIDVSTLGGGSSDNCAVASVTVDSGQLNTTFDCSTIGDNVVTVTVTDVNGNVSTCDAIVTVEDNTNPNASCASITVQLDPNGEVIITPVLVDNGSFDNCGIDTMTVLPQMLDCNNVGSNSVILTVTDVNGNISTCIATVTAEDTIPPTAVCTDITVQLNGNGTAVIAAGDIDDGSFDNCGIQSITIDVNTFDCSNIGPNTVELTVTDVNGNVSTCTSTATVVDEVDPLLACQNITVQLNPDGEVTITALDVDNGSTDNCGIDTMTVNITDFDCSNVGTNQVTLTVTDLYGNFDICQAVVTVLDTVPPTAVCQDITIQLDATGSASIVAADVDGGSNDACGVDAIAVDQTIFDCTQVGPNAITLTVVDVNGNISTCEAIVTVEDNINPNANCQDITIYIDANGAASILASDINAGSNANCGVDTVFVNPNAFDCSNVGNNTVTLTVVDNNGNSSTCTANVEVLDTINPTALCQDITVQLNNNGQATITAADIDNGSFDNCDVATIAIDNNTFDCTVVGSNIITLTITDVNGNISTCTANVAAEDTIAPNATCTPLVVQLDAIGNATITPEQIDLNSSDNCAIDNLALDNDSFNCSNIGANTVELTVTDVNGNTSTCTATVIVEDNVPPVTSCVDITVYLDATGQVAIIPADVDGGSTDNCAVDTLYVTPNDFSCSGVGANPVVLTVIDVNGNVSSCTATVTVLDTISPIAVCQDITIQLDGFGNASIDATEIDNGSNDACGVLNLTVDINTFDCTNVGANTVVLTVEDNNGNTSTCTAEVTIEDNVAPNAICQDLTVTLDGNGTVTVSAGEVDGGSTDNCAIDTMFIAQNDFTCADLGTNIINLTVVDVNGNIDICAAEITVLDTLNPVIIGCPTDTVIVPDSSDCSPQVFWTEPTTEDNCTATLTSDFVPGDNFPVGTTTVTYTSTDQSGNSVSCSFDVTIEPSPVLVVIVAQEGPCGYNLSCNGAADGEATANVSGGCLPYAYDWSDGQTTQTAVDLDAGSYAVTVTDANGTTATQTVIITQPDVLATDSLTSPEYVGGANISCNGEFDGAVNINVIGGSECVTYGFIWSGPNGFTSTSEDLAGLEAGTYVVAVTDANGCSYQDSITITEPAELASDSLVSDYNGVNISCGGAADGWIDLTVSGGAAPYTFAWSNGDTTEDIDSLMAGIYTYIITDANGCEITGSITLTEPDGLSSFITTSDYNGYQISCHGLADGSIDLSVNEGTQPYSYLWNNGETTEDLTDLEAGTYIVDITDANGCTLVDSVNITEADSLVLAAIDVNQISCNGAADGSAFVQATGGVPVLLYSWSDGQMGPTGEDLESGIYTAVVTDLNGCQDSILIQITQPFELEAYPVEIQDVICSGEDNGLVDVNVVGGTAPYTYDWSNNTTDQDLNGVGAGTYFLEVTDGNGCVDTLTVVVGEPAQLIMTVDTVIDATCSGVLNGEITVAGFGGTPPYTYFWPNINQTGPTVTGLGAGVYEVQVVDANNCSWSLNVVVGQPSSIEAQIDVQTVVSCNGLSDAEALVTVAGGTSPYTYLWSNSDTDSLASDLGAGSHSVTVTDAAGCDTTLTFEITEPTVIDISIDTIYNVTCNGIANGQVEVDVEGGTIPYTVSWSNGDVGYVANNLEAGAHTVYVTDGNGCMDSLMTVVSQPDTMELIQHSTTMVSCFGGNDGQATVLVDGGTPPITYSWPLIGQTGASAIDLEAGWYLFIATDANGCNYSDSIEITQPEEIVVTVTSDTAVCPGNGLTITASATGGAGNYSYSWDNGLGLGATHFVNPSVSTTYNVEVFDQSGCPAAIASVTVDIAETPVAAFSSASDAPCVLPTTVDFTNMSSNATEFAWTFGNSETSTDENPTTTYDVAGTYTVTLIATSAAGCTDTVTGTVFVDEVPTAEFTLDNAQGCAPLQVNFGLNAPTGYEFYWDFGDGTTSTAPNPTHWYEIPGDFDVTLIVSAPGGCTDTVTSGAAVTAYPSPIADFTPQQVIFPEPGSEYDFINNSSGADLYNWDFGTGDQTDEYQPTYDFPGYGGYFVTLTAINEYGCADTAVHYLNVDLTTGLFVPNAMGIGEPGEAGIFIPKGVGIQDYHVWIFDNWGNLLWESTALNNGSPSEGWDGYYKGQTVPQGSYVWKINAVFIDGEIWEGMEYSNGKRNTGSIMVLY